MFEPAPISDVVEPASVLLGRPAGPALLSPVAGVVAFVAARRFRYARAARYAGVGG